MQDITIYVTTNCPYCVSAKRLLTSRGYPFKEIDLTHNMELRETLSRENQGYRTVPMIFIGTKFIGGFDNLAQLDQSGKLKDLVQATND